MMMMISSKALKIWPYNKSLRLQFLARTLVCVGMLFMRIFMGHNMGERTRQTLGAIFVDSRASVAV